MLTRFMKPHQASLELKDDEEGILALGRNIEAAFMQVNPQDADIPKAPADELVPSIAFHNQSTDKDVIVTGAGDHGFSSGRRQTRLMSVMMGEENLPASKRKKSVVVVPESSQRKSFVSRSGTTVEIGRSGTTMEFGRKSFLGARQGTSVDLSATGGLPGSMRGTPSTTPRPSLSRPRAMSTVSIGSSTILGPMDFSDDSWGK